MPSPLQLLVPAALLFVPPDVCPLGALEIGSYGSGGEVAGTTPPTLLYSGTCTPFTEEPHNRYLKEQRLAMRCRYVAEEAVEEWRLFELPDVKIGLCGTEQRCPIPSPCRCCEEQWCPGE
jgi:hypothetical protein